LLKLVEVIGELLESFLEGGEFGGAPGDWMTGLQDLLLVEEGFQADFELLKSGAGSMRD
jgi:hypothetical protein